MNVFEAAKERVSKMFDEFGYVYVSFSGGKDSGVLLNIVSEEAKRRGVRFGVYHMDYECQYQATTDYVADMLDSLRDVADIYHICLPIKAQTSSSMFDLYWRPWEKSKKDIWVREIPKGAITESEIYKETMWDYDYNVAFGEWISREKGCDVCCMVGIRTQESLNRWRAIFSDKNYKNHKGLKWTRSIGKGVVNAYPIYDFTTKDIWVANARQGWKYNKLYDLYWQAGLNIDQMRVASPFTIYGQSSLKLYRVIEPRMWSKMIGRVNGVNFTCIYGGTTAMGWKSIKKPKGYTWEDFMFFLLKTLPEKTRRHYLEKLEVSMKFWREKGGCLSDEVIKKLRDAGVKIDVGYETNYATSKKPVRMDYIDDIDITEFREIPTFKRMCICILKNDHFCKYMGFSLTKNELERRKNVIEKYKNLL